MPVRGSHRMPTAWHVYRHDFSRTRADPTKAALPGDHMRRSSVHGMDFTSRFSTGKIQNRTGNPSPSLGTTCPAPKEAKQSLHDERPRTVHCASGTGDCNDKGRQGFSMSASWSHRETPARTRQSFACITSGDARRRRSSARAALRIPLRRDDPDPSSPERRTIPCTTV